MAPASGLRLGPYEITGPLGAGGMGEVYCARDTKLTTDAIERGIVVGIHWPAALKK